MKSKKKKQKNMWNSLKINFNLWVRKYLKKLTVSKKKRRKQISIKKFNLQMKFKNFKDRLMKVEEKCNNSAFRDNLYKNKILIWECN